MRFLNPFEDPIDNYKAAPMPGRLHKNSRVAIVTGNNTEDLEFFYPYYRFCEAGYQVDVITPEGGPFEGKKGLGLKETLKVEAANPSDYDLLYLPGGRAPAELREDAAIVDFIRNFAQTDKPIASICHGAQLLIAADLVKGAHIAAWPEMKEEVEDACAVFVDEALVQDGRFITARKPGDLPRHLAGVLDYLNGLGNTNTASPKAVA